MMYVGKRHTRSVMRLNTPPDDLTASERWDQVLRLMSHEPRRRLILALSEEEPTASVELPDAADSPHITMTRRDLSTTLHHHHLPALADADYVWWRSSPFEAGRGPNFEEAAAVIGMILSYATHLPNRMVRGCEPLESRVG